MSVTTPLDYKAKVEVTIQKNLKISDDKQKKILAA